MRKKLHTIVGNWEVITNINEYDYLYLGVYTGNLFDILYKLSGYQYDHFNVRLTGEPNSPSSVIKNIAIKDKVLFTIHKYNNDAKHINKLAILQPPKHKKWELSKNDNKLELTFN